MPAEFGLPNAWNALSAAFKQMMAPKPLLNFQGSSTAAPRFAVAAGGESAFLYFGSQLFFCEEGITDAFDRYGIT